MTQHEAGTVLLQEQIVWDDTDLKNRPQTTYAFFNSIYTNVIQIWEHINNT